ncbi:MAG: short-chain dehydrogenase/reductase [Gemmataceae bacterium]|nr:short-chain dehydrogenase/reductase [Gemmataceae bacterium]
MKTVILITGAASVFGALAARALARAGHPVHASMCDTMGRNAPQITEAKQYAAEPGADLRAVELGVGSQPSADAAGNTIVADTGRLDGVAHNAGHMVFGPAEAFTAEQLAHLYDVNGLGTSRYIAGIEQFVDGDMAQVEGWVPPPVRRFRSTTTAGDVSVIEGRPA